mmetsp:Transcript_6601/g.22749  ORF Transcript_6601/g.22749 Transcript_6601/m.22749 type:complete len:268 (-) Transcript_6601:2035-2838(-)
MMRCLRRSKSSSMGSMSSSRSTEEAMASARGRPGGRASFLIAPFSCIRSSSTVPNSSCANCASKLSLAPSSASSPAASASASMVMTFSSIRSKAARAEPVFSPETVSFTHCDALADWARALSMFFFCFASPIFDSRSWELALSFSSTSVWEASWARRAAASVWAGFMRWRASLARLSSPLRTASSARRCQSVAMLFIWLYLTSSSLREAMTCAVAWRSLMISFVMSSTTVSIIRSGSSWFRMNWVQDDRTTRPRRPTRPSERADTFA